MNDVVKTQELGDPRFAGVVGSSSSKGPVGKALLITRQYSSGHFRSQLYWADVKAFDHSVVKLFIF